MKAARTAYEVRSIDGNLAARHIRLESSKGKRFVWELPDGTSGLGGMRIAELPLYRSEQLPKWVGSAIVVVEGEKACDVLASVGIPAVASVTGASSCPGPAALAVLRDQDVVLWPDADVVGARHMDSIARALYGIARSVRRFEWSGAPPGGDAADYVAQGAEATTRLAEDVSAAPDYVVSAEPMRATPTDLVEVEFGQLPNSPSRDDLVAVLLRLAAASEGMDRVGRVAMRQGGDCTASELLHVPARREGAGVRSVCHSS